MGNEAKANSASATHWPKGKAYAGLVLAIAFGLNLSDYMSRYVVVALFPDLRQEWALSNADLGGLVSVVALVVGLLAVPVALLAERFGRARCLTLMAVLWSAATFICAHVSSYGHMLAARVLVGVGEAAYSTVGLALLFSLFPRGLRASVSGTFLSSGPLGQVLGIVLGGAIGSAFGWRHAFSAMAAFGFILAILFLLLVREPTGARQEDDGLRLGTILPLLREVLTTRPIPLLMLAGGLQFFTFAGFLAWAPSWLQSVYGLASVASAKRAAALVLLAVLGMLVCSNIADRVARQWNGGRAIAATLFCATTGIAFAVGFSLPTGLPQLVLIALGVFTGGAAIGPGSAIFAERLRPAAHGVAFSCAAITNNLIGQAPAPWVIGKIADHSSLSFGLACSAAGSCLAAVTFLRIRELCLGQHVQQHLQAVEQISQT